MSSGTIRAWLCRSCQARYPMPGSPFCVFCARGKGDR